MSTRVQATGKHTESAASDTLAFVADVQAGNLIVVTVAKVWDTTDAFAVGDCTQSAGTATTGAVALDVARELLDSSSYFNVGIFSIPVTGSGSCTIQIANATAGSYWFWAVEEYTGVDVSVNRLADSNTGQATGTAVATGNVTVPEGGVIVGIETENVSATCTHAEDAAFGLIYESDTGSSNLTGSVIDRVVGASVTDAASWTIGLSAAWVAVVAAYRASPPVHPSDWRYFPLPHSQRSV